VSDCFVGVPVKLTNKGAEKIYQFELSPAESEAFKKSVAANVELMNITKGFL
jgi:malate/lactate dehydrogenase